MTKSRQGSVRTPWKVKLHTFLRVGGLLLTLAAIGCTERSPANSDDGGGSPIDGGSRDSDVRDAGSQEGADVASDDVGSKPTDVNTDTQRNDAVSNDANRDSNADAAVDATGDAASENPVDARAEDVDASVDVSGDIPIDQGSPPIEGGSPDGGPTFNCVGAVLGALPEAGTATLVPSLGFQGTVQGLLKDGDFVAGSDSAFNQYSGGWILWNAASGKEIASGMPGKPVGLAGGVLAVSDAGQLRVYAASDGSLSATIAISAPSSSGLATDGSYVWATSSTGVSIWSPAGVPLASKSGDYATASVFAAPGQLLVARGAAGADVIENIPVNGGAATTSPTFSGTFNVWFLDGTKFLSVVGSDVFVYTAQAAQVQIVPISIQGVFGGAGSYFWNDHGGIASFDVFAVGGNGQPIKTYNYGVDGQAGVSLHRLAMMGYSVPTMTVVNLDTYPFAEQTVALPFPFNTAFAGDANGFWVVGGSDGKVLHSGTASTPSRSGSLGCGALLEMAGSTGGVAALGTVSGVVILNLLESSSTALNLVAGPGYGPDAPDYRGIALSSDGHTLMARASSYGNLNNPDRSLYIYTWPSWGMARSFPYTASVSAWWVAFDLSLDATTIARTVGRYSGSNWTVDIDVSDITGTTSVWSSVGGSTNSVPLLSPNGRHFALTDVKYSASSSTSLYEDGVLKNAIPGTPAGWLDDTRLLVQKYVSGGSDSGGNADAGSYGNSTTIYDALGNVLSTPTLPEIRRFDVIGPTTIFSRQDSNFYDVTSGGVTTTGLPTPSAAVGSFIVSRSGRALQVTRY